MVTQVTLPLYTYMLLQLTCYRLAELFEYQNRHKNAKQLFVNQYQCLENINRSMLLGEKSLAVFNN